MVINRHNTPSIEGRELSPQTRYSLTKKQFVTRKNKSKRVDAKGNGFVITEKGRRFLADNPLPTTRKSSIIIKNEKTCGKCNLLKPITEFVTIYGVKNPRGKYCKNCFEFHQQQHAMSLMEGRDFCLYCGKKIKKVYDWKPEGKPEKTYLHLDHMDPLSLGGEDSKSNTVYCCVDCNLQKGNKTYTEWLKELKQDNREIARHIYLQKHGRAPEDFKPSDNKFVLTIDLANLFKE